MKIAAWFILGTVLLTGCDDTVFGEPIGGSGDGGTDDGGSDGGTDGGGTDDGGTDGADSGDEDAEGWCYVEGLTQRQCLACHSAAAQMGGLDLETDPWTAMVNQPSSLYPDQTLVVPGAPADSLLYLKTSGTQGESLGGVMPPSGALDADGQAKVAAWITEGAGSECSEPDTGDTGVARYHPEDWRFGTEHGMAAKLHDQTCTTCHGDSLQGNAAAASCDTCHDEGWRTDCTFCHGGTDNATGAPPQTIRNEPTDTTFGVHSAHVQTTIHGAYDCTTCHDKPTDVLTTGHLFDSTPGQAEMNFGAGLSPAGSWSSASMACSNLYCHGNGQGDNGSVMVSDAPMSCDSCHPDASSGRDAWDTMSGEHEDHLREGLECRDCHSTVVDASQAIIDPALHVNGSVNFQPDGGTIVRTGDTCNGACHGETHNDRDWD